MSIADYGCGWVAATNALKHLINQSEERILLIDQSKNASKHGGNSTAFYVDGWEFNNFEEENK